jgi:S-adenosylmethionine:tRNA ribosyltransferase-isomerase
MEVELYDIPRETAAAVERGKGQGQRLVAVGTTTTRALEYAWSGAEGRFSRLEGGADIFIYPGYRFGCIDALLTNFHLPESTLIMLVSALVVVPTATRRCPCPFPRSTAAAVSRGMS